MCHTCHLTFFTDLAFLALFLTLFGLKLVLTGNKYVKKIVEKHNLDISCGCLLLRNSKRFIQNCHQNASFFGLSFGQIWPSLVQIFGPNDFKMSKIKFLNTWNLLWLLSVVFSGNPNYYIPPSNRKCNVQCRADYWSKFET